MWPALRRGFTPPEPAAAFFYFHPPVAIVRDGTLTGRQ